LRIDEKDIFSILGAFEVMGVIAAYSALLNLERRLRRYIPKGDSDVFLQLLL